MQVMHVISGLRNGGAEAILARLVTRDTEDDHCVVSMMTDDYHGARLRRQGIEVIELDMPPGALTLKGLRTLFRLLRERKPEVVQTWMYHADLVGGTLARLAGRPHVFWGLHHTTLDAEQTSRTIRLLARVCAAASWIVPTRVVSCSAEGVRVHAGLGYRRSRFVVVNNGYDIDEFTPDAEVRENRRRSLGVAGDTALLGMVGRWHEQKDHENLLRALSLLQERRPAGWHCMMVGPGVDEDNEALVTSRAAKGLDASVTLAGPTDAVPGLMNALDLHVLPSAFGEAFPNVVAEAMACGTPCVVTDIGDAALMVGDSGWVVPPADPAALVAAIEEALDARAVTDDWTVRREGCVRRVRERFGLKRMVAAYREVWMTALNPAADRRRSVADRTNEDR